MAARVLSEAEVDTLTISEPDWLMVPPNTAEPGPANRKEQGSEAMGGEKKKKEGPRRATFRDGEGFSRDHAFIDGGLAQNHIAVRGNAAARSNLGTGREEKKRMRRNVRKKRESKMKRKERYPNEIGGLQQRNVQRNGLVFRKRRMSDGRRTATSVSFFAFSIGR
jgi:hypothetical protein